MSTKVDTLLLLKPKERKAWEIYLSNGFRQIEAYLETHPASMKKYREGWKKFRFRGHASKFFLRIKKKLEKRSCLRRMILVLTVFSGRLTNGWRQLLKNITKMNLWESTPITQPGSGLPNYWPTSILCGKTISTLVILVLLVAFQFIFPTTAGANPRNSQMEIRPQPGPQEDFLATSADIAIIGGAAGGCKSYSLLLEPLRHITISGFNATIFRRTSPQITQGGGLWDTASEIYPHLGGRPIEQPYRYSFPKKTKIEFHHLQHEKNILDWQGSQIPLIEFDELTHFTEKQFFYMLSRNRSICGVRPYIRGACNPDPNSFVKNLISWWLDKDEEYADQSKAGIIRWFLRSGDDMLWFDIKNEALDYARDILKNTELVPKSFTFIPSSIYDNKILLEKDPGYLANLMALPRIDKKRLLNGNWKIRATAGTIFSRDDFEIVDSVPQPDRAVRCWDRAATEPHSGNKDPDYTAGIKMQKTGNVFFITDVVRKRVKSSIVKTTIKNTASQDGTAITICLLFDPGAAGKYEISDYYKLLVGYSISTVKETTKKYLKWQPFAAQCQAGNVKLLRGAWNDSFLNELENLAEDEKEYAHDDQGDGASGAFEFLTSNAPWRPL